MCNTVNEHKVSFLHHNQLKTQLFFERQYLWPSITTVSACGNSNSQATTANCNCETLCGKSVSSETTEKQRL